MDEPKKECLALLRSARELVADRERWTQGVLARNRRSRLEVPPFSQLADCWCAWGAFIKAAEEVDIGRGLRMELTTKVLGCGGSST